MVWLVLAAMARAVSAQSSSISDLTLGKLLVASQKARDPAFAQTVVLLVHYDQQGAVGLILNRPLNMGLSGIFPGLKAAKDRRDAVYGGGPLAIGLNGLIRAKTKPAGSAPVFGDLHLISNRRALEKTVESGVGSDVFHVFVGYTGWSPQQLKDEVQRGLWYIFESDAGVVFDPASDSMWRRLIQKKTTSRECRRHGTVILRSQSGMSIPTSTLARQQHYPRNPD